MNFKSGSLNTHVSRHEALLSIIFTYSNAQNAIKYMFLPDPELGTMAMVGKTDTT